MLSHTVAPAFLPCGGVQATGKEAENPKTVNIADLGKQILGFGEAKGTKICRAENPKREVRQIQNPRCLSKALLDFFNFKGNKAN